MLQRPVRMKLYCCSFMVYTNSEAGLGFAVDITPIIAQEETQVLHLIWQKHKHYLLEHMTTRAYAPDIGCIPPEIRAQLQINELAPVWSLTPYITPVLRTSVE